MFVPVSLLLLGACALDLSGIGELRPDDGRDAAAGDASPPPTDDGGRPDAGRPRDGGRRTDGAPGDDAGPALDAGDPDSGPAPVALPALLVELPCGPERYVGGLGCDMHGDDSDAATLSGPAGTSTVTFRVRGVVELNDYLLNDGGSGFYRIGGTPLRPGWSIISLTIGSPSAVYHLNTESVPSGNFCVPLDYTFSVPVDSGSTVTLFATPGDTAGWRNLDLSGAPLIVGGVPLAEPYDGQFVYVTVEP